MFKFPNFLEDVEEIIAISQRIEANGRDKKSDGHLQQNDVSWNMSQGKKCKKFGPSKQHTSQVEGTSSNKSGYQRRKPSNVKIKGGDMKDKWCKKYGKFGHFQPPDLKV